ncbi:MAG TPA: transcriptional regulator [Planococcus sp. (in: firmicutes)]|nr:transcriptional regulator [Planococcus sp. (in: firmicutes)]
MKAQILKAFKHQQPIHMIYMAGDGSISKRRVKILSVSGDSFQAYCFLRNRKRTFKIDNVLSLRPVLQKERLII